MKFGIVTHYDVHNHGAVLQLTALVKVLASKNIKAKALRFDKNYDFLGVALKQKYDISLKSIGFYLKFLLHKGFGQTLYNVRKRRTLNKFKTQNNLIGEYYTEVKHLDAVIIGSDEVFALHTGPTPIFFGHAAPTDYVFSYAASFGPTTYNDINSKHCLEFVKGGLISMIGVSVRDKNSQDIVLKLTEKAPTIVCDPVILYGYTDEIKQLKQPKLPPYLLVYAYDNRMNDSNEVEKIKNYARRHNLKIVSPGFYHKWCDYNINVDPINLLAYFKYAQCIVTDTFHGSVMSIITHSQFAVKTRDNSNKLVNLLEEYGLTSRISTSLDDLNEKFTSRIDFTVVENEVKNRRKASMEYLDKMIEKVYEHCK